MKRQQTIAKEFCEKMNVDFKTIYVGKGEHWKSYFSISGFDANDKYYDVIIRHHKSTDRKSIEVCGITDESLKIAKILKEIEPNQVIDYKISEVVYTSKTL